MFKFFRSVLLFTSAEPPSSKHAEVMGVTYRITKVEPIKLGGFAVWGREWL
jgi:hypothetical protein